MDILKGNTIEVTQTMFKSIERFQDYEILKIEKKVRLPSVKEMKSHHLFLV